MDNLANFQQMIDNTIANLREGKTEHTPALRVSGSPTPFAAANPQLANSLLGDSKLLIDVYALARAYARQRIPAFDLEDGAVLQIVLSAYHAKGVPNGGSR